MTNYTILLAFLANSLFSFADQPFQDARGENRTKAKGIVLENHFNFKKHAASGAGYLLLGEAEYGISIGQDKHDFLKLTVINGYRFNPFFSLGLGTGLKYFYMDKDLVIPVFLDIRTNFLHGRLSPYMALGIGYSIDVTNDYTVEDVDFLLNPAAGICYNINERFALNFGIGYEMQRMRFLNDLNHSLETENSRGICIKTGLSF